MNSGLYEKDSEINSAIEEAKGFNMITSKSSKVLPFAKTPGKFIAEQQ